MSNQVATGLALTLFGLGLSSLIGKPYEGMKAPTLAKLDLPVLCDIPGPRPDPVQPRPDGLSLARARGRGLGGADATRRAGLILRAVGENHDAAHALGYKVVRVRFGAILFGGALRRARRRLREPGAGAAMGRGHDRRRGLDRAGDRRLRLAGGRGGCCSAPTCSAASTVLQLNLQAAGVAIPVEYLSMSPYLVTILVLVIISVRGNHGAPGSLGRVFHAAR